MRILYLSEIKWRYLRTRKQQMARRFPKDWQILFVEPYALGRENRFHRQRENNVTYITVPYFKNFPQAWMRKLVGFAPVRAGVIITTTFWLWSVLQLSGFREPNILVVSNIYYAPIVRLLFRKTPLIYDCNDDHLAFPMTPSWAPRYFTSLCRRADRIVCSSRALQKKIHREHNHKVLFIGNGVDARLFQERVMAPPEEMKDLPSPIILLHGALSERIDMALLKRIACTHPDKTLVLIGPVTPAVQPSLRELLQRPNVRYLGEINHDRIPAHLSVADVCLIPFVKNDLTAGMNPNKLYEYLAAGKAVVSMDTSPEVIACRHDIFLASDHESFMRQLEAALAAAHTHLDRRRQLAFANDWQEKADQFSAVIKSLAK